MESIGHSAESIAQAFLRAINRQDVDRLAELMAPTHRFIDALGNTVEGREKMRGGWAAYFRMVPDYSVAIEEFYPGEPVVVMIGMASGTFTRDGNLNPENRWQTPIAIRASIDDGLVAEWRVYADNDPIRKLMAGGR
jgi:ketosteroid isomerase-like protein